MLPCLGLGHDQPVQIVRVLPLTRHGARSQSNWGLVVRERLIS
ncbi:MAG: hypothetical protein MOP51_2035 [Citricoccus sp.]|jgi:hypothetical protein|nr:hypothetical protein [Citricoccus sp. WCRC_4]